MRWFLLGVCQLVLRVFFRRIEVVGRERLPSNGPLILVLNHPNGLVDPLFVLCLLGRPVSLLAKEPLFRMFFVGMFVRSFRCLPVYRAKDGADPSKNKAMIRDAIALLSAGNVLALFPEGISHSEPALQPLKPGAARIALSARAGIGAERGVPVQIVPIGLDYSVKHRFRSDALVSIGEPVAVPSVDLDEQFRPPRAATAELTDRLRRALADVTLEAESTEALRLAHRVARILHASELDVHDGETAPPPSRASLRDHRELRAKLLAGYHELKRSHPEAVIGLLARVDSYEQAMRHHGLCSDQKVRYSGVEKVMGVLRTLLAIVLLCPLALVGCVINYPTYRLIGVLAFRVMGAEQDVVATVKMVGGALLFPLTWLLFAAAATSHWGTVGMLSFLLGPVGGYATLVLVERANRGVAFSYAAALLTLRPGLRRWVLAERRQIARETNQLAAQLSA